ncbi:MAG: hypothetical protein HOE90_09605 [Bacteriovoracaceae bacterium]|jgi:hypothetical protein|nr:hypothetical protein [Bacteriovoracaceae bacterium]
MNIKKLLLLFIVVSTLSVDSIAGFPQQFVLGMTDICGEFSPMKSKKILLLLIKSKHSGSNPCEDKFLKALTAQCKEKESSCSKIVGLFTNLESENRGTVVGE